jgi:hypothetical protein
LVNVQNPPKVAKPASTDASAKSSTTLVASTVFFRMRSCSVTLRTHCGESEQINGTARKYPSCCEAQNGSHSGAGHQWNRLGICVDIRTVALTRLDVEDSPRVGEICG